MPDTLSISDRGLRLIKAFEGFRPVDRQLVSGARVVGYGHKLPDDRPRTVTEAEADGILRSDLAPFEDMVNANTYAAITQDQFDALTSLAFNIGPRAFLESDVLRAVNGGRPLEAARGFDAWRLARVGGERFVVDALVRRRTAERALFLRPPEGALTPKAPTPDLAVEPGPVALDAAPALDRDGAGRLVMDAPYDVERLITSVPQRRADDGPAGDLAESERGGPGADSDAVSDAAPDVDTPPELELDDGTARPSALYAELDAAIAESALAVPAADDGAVSEDTLVEDSTNEGALGPARSRIAEAADDVRDRLQALLDAPEGADTAPGQGGLADALPDTLLPRSTPTDGDPTLGATNVKVVRFPGRPPVADSDADGAAAEARGGTGAGMPPVGPPAPIVDDLPPPDPALLRANPALADEGAALADTAGGDSAPTPAQPAPNWVRPHTPGEAARAAGEPAAWPFFLILAVGGALFGAGAALVLRDVALVAGLPGRLVGIAGAMVGTLVLLGALLALVRHYLQPRHRRQP